MDAHGLWPVPEPLALIKSTLGKPVDATGVGFGLVWPATLIPHEPVTFLWERPVMALDMQLTTLKHAHRTAADMHATNRVHGTPVAIHLHRQVGYPRRGTQ